MYRLFIVSSILCILAAWLAPSAADATCPDIICSQRHAQCTNGVVNDEYGNRQIVCDWPSLTCNTSDIRRAISNYGTCMPTYGINTTCAKPSIFVESTDECNMYGDTAYGGVLRCEYTRQFGGRPRNACVMRRLPGDPCNPSQAQECSYGQHACVGFACLGLLENGTCSDEHDCIGGMECRCYRSGCSTAEQVCRPLLRINQACSLPTGDDDMVTRSCEVGSLCNAVTGKCTRIYSITNDHVASDDRLCVSQYRDGNGNCTTWPNPKLVSPSMECNNDTDCITVPPGHGRCVCSTLSSGNKAMCQLTQTEAPDAEMAKRLTDLLKCASRANCHIEHQTLRAGMSTYMQTCLSQECRKEFDRFSCQVLELEWDKPVPVCAVENDRRLWFQQLGAWHKCIDAPYEDVEVRPLWSSELGLTLLISGSILVAAFIVVLLRRWCITRQVTSKFSGHPGGAINGAAGDVDDNELAHSHHDRADRASASHSRNDSGSINHGSYSQPLLTREADDDNDNTGDHSDHDGSDGDDDRSNNNSRLAIGGHHIPAGILRKSASGRSLADEAAASAAALAENGHFEAADPPLLRIAAEGQQHQQHHQHHRGVTFEPMNRSASSATGFMRSSHHQQRQHRQQVSNGVGAPAVSSRAKPKKAVAAPAAPLSRWQLMSQNDAAHDHNDDDVVAMVVGSAPL